MFNVRPLCEINAAVHKSFNEIRPAMAKRLNTPGLEKNFKTYVFANLNKST